MCRSQESMEKGRSPAGALGCAGVTLIALAAAMLVMGLSCFVGAGWGTGHPWDWYLGGSDPTEWPVVVTVSAGGTGLVNASADEVPLGHYDVVGGADEGAPLLYVVCKNEGDSSGVFFKYGSNRPVDVGSLDATRVHRFPHQGFQGQTLTGDYPVSVHKGVGGGVTTLAVGPHKPGVPDAQLACACPANTLGHALCPGGGPPSP